MFVRERKRINKRTTNQSKPLVSSMVGGKFYGKRLNSSTYKDLTRINQKGINISIKSSARGLPWQFTG